MMCALGILIGKEHRRAQKKNEIIPVTVTNEQTAQRHFFFKKILKRNKEKMLKISKSKQKIS